jgi:alpha-N-arabinofuranosidase
MWASWVGTVVEAVFLIGIERNTDHIIGASYAALLANLNDYQWTVSFLLAYDSLI